MLYTFSGIFPPETRSGPEYFASSSGTNTGLIIGIFAMQHRDMFSLYTSRSRGWGSLQLQVGANHSNSEYCIIPVAGTDTPGRAVRGTCVRL